jgi:predicted RNase H-like nuclease (RuvC/YqgF family)
LNKLKFESLEREVETLRQRVNDQAASNRELVSRVRSLEKLNNRIIILKDDFLRATAQLNTLFLRFKVLCAERRYSDQLEEWLGKDSVNTPKDRQW